MLGWWAHFYSGNDLPGDEAKKQRRCDGRGGGVGGRGARRPVLHANELKKFKSRCVQRGQNALVCKVYC